MKGWMGAGGWTTLFILRNGSYITALWSRIKKQQQQNKTTTENQPTNQNKPARSLRCCYLGLLCVLGTENDIFFQKSLCSHIVVGLHEIKWSTSCPVAVPLLKSFSLLHTKLISYILNYFRISFMDLNFYVFQLVYSTLTGDCGLFFLSPMREL